MPGNHRRLGGKSLTAAEAYGRGYRFAIVAPKGHVVSFHTTDRAAGSGLYSLRKAGCRMERLEEVLR